ncbi:putative sterol delta 5,6-desaturase [Violaceomyces palustris]|uniref:Sterol delta 5,6-desaturase n=1 Tax=Violaceomyces palustris TaxID=1673888 RepID=A0ACD0P5L3_9BASI|nr:putative sterol delta 5,6-desaturase [Violaceomyces palustris]
MDVVLHYADEWVLDAVWAKIYPAVPRSVAKGSELVQAASRNGAGQAGAKLISNFTNGLAAAATAGASASSGTASGVAKAVADSDVAWESLQGVSALGRDNIVRQFLSLLTITYIGIFILYFLFAGLSYKYLFNKEMMKHPRFHKNQVRLEIECSLRAFFPLDLMTVPWFVAEVRGHSMMYSNISDYGWLYAVLSVPLFLVFTDTAIYWIHRLEHHPLIYKHIHKPHHKWLVPTPFASHAFHPIDGYAQSLPYHIFPFIFPLHRFIFMGLFVFVNLWSILIHDSDMICNSPLEKVINGPSHHTLHHLFFTCNYGQYFTTCDRLGGSYRAPKPEDDPLLAITGVGEKAKKEVANGEGESKKSQ